MPRIERRRLTLDDRDDRRRDQVQRERPKVGLEFFNPICGRKKIQSDLWTQKENLTDDDVTNKNRTRERTEDNETEQRRDERVFLDRVAERLGCLSGRPSGRPVSDPPKTTRMGAGLARAQNREMLNKTLIEK